MYSAQLPRKELLITMAYRTRGPSDVVWWWHWWWRRRWWWCDRWLWFSSRSRILSIRMSRISRGLRRGRYWPYWLSTSASESSASDVSGEVPLWFPPGPHTAFFNMLFSCPILDTQRLLGQVSMDPDPDDRATREYPGHATATEGSSCGVTS